MEFQFIVNPQTNRKCNINSRQGQRVLNNYLNQSGGLFGPSKHEKLFNHCMENCSESTVQDCHNGLKGSKHYDAWHDTCVVELDRKAEAAKAAKAAAAKAAEQRRLQAKRARAGY